MNAGLTMKLLCTGISGMQKIKYLERLKPFLEEHGQIVEIFDTWEYLSRAGDDLGQKVTKEKVLDLHNLDALRAIAFERICAEIEQQLKSHPETHILISTHGCFRWNNTLRSGFDLHYLNRIDPDVYVNFMEDARKISANLSNDSQWADRLTLNDIIIWRDEEMFITESLAMFQKKPFYIIAGEEVLTSLGNMILHPDRKKIYLSFPITAIQQEQPGLIKEAATFADRLRQKYIVFDPLSVKDLHDIDGLTKKDQKLLKAATVWRDFKLISQSDLVAVYYPVEKNSPGVNQEIMYAFTHGKDVYLYYPQKFGMSPFWDPELAVTQRFSTLDDFQNFFQEIDGNDQRNEPEQSDSDRNRT